MHEEILNAAQRKLLPLMKVDMPYHLEPGHYEAGEIKADNGRDAAY